MSFRVRVHLASDPEIRATLAALRMNVESAAPGGNGPGPQEKREFVVRLDAENAADAQRAVRDALRRWGDVQVDALST